MNSNTEVPLATVARTCGNCARWAKREEGEKGHNQGLGQCLNVPSFFDATEESDNCMYGPDRGAIKPTFGRFKAFALDGSGFLAELLVAPDFGCNAHEATTS